MSEELKGRELGWDDEIEKGADYVLLPEGEYDFTIESFERGRFEGRRLDDAECEAMTREADAINEKYQSDLAKDMLVSVIREVSKDARMKIKDTEE